MALTITETIITRCDHKQISSDDLRVFCSAVGVTTTRRPEYSILKQKLMARCNALRPLLNCDGLEAVLCGVENLGKKSLQHLSAQHNLDVDPERDVDSMKDVVVDHVTSGGCQASTSSLCLSVNEEYGDGDAGADNDLETYILQLAVRKTKLSKKALRRVLKSRNIEFDDDENIGELRRHLRSHITKIRKGKRSEWSRNKHAELESEHNRRLDEIQEEWPQPAPMDLKEDCVRNFRAATSSESLC